MSRIMVVDDEVIVTTQLEERLSLMGFEVVGRASSGETCIEMARKLRPDLILMDIVMPGEVDGIDASKAIKRELDIPVIFVTAYSDDKLIGRARETEPYGYILKPFQERELKAAIEVALYKRSMEQQLREWEERYRLVVNNANDAIASIDARGKIIFWNRTAENMFGYSTDEIAGKPATLIVPERFHGNLLRIVSRAISNGKSVAGGKPVEFYGLRKDGSEFPLELSVASWKTQKGVFLTSIIRDITERKKAEVAIQERMRFETLLSDLSAAFINLPSDKVEEGIVHWLQRVVEFLDVDRSTIFEISEDETKLHPNLHYSAPGIEPIPSLAIDEIFPWYTGKVRRGEIILLESVDDLPEDAVAEKEYFTGVDLKSNLTIPLQVGGKIMGAIALGAFQRKRSCDEQLVSRVRLIGEIFANALLRKRAEEALHRSEQTIRELAQEAAQAHEKERERLALEVHDRLSQNLTAAFHQLQALGCFPLKDAAAQQALLRASDIMKECIGESRNIMEDLYSPVLSDFGIVAVIDDELRHFKEDTGCEAKLNAICPVRPPLEVELNIYRIFREALANIRKHATGAKNVKVSLVCKDGLASLMVCDDGCGFDVESALRSKQVRGLAGMRRRAEIAGGACNIESVAGKGTTVSVTLPYKSAPKAEQKTI